MTAGMHVLIVDDESPVREHLAGAIKREFPEAVVSMFDSPASLAASVFQPEPTHAFVDLSFARDRQSYETARSGQPTPELGIGADAIHLLSKVAPDCLVAVITALDSDLHREMAQAVVEYWNDTAFIHKQNPSYTSEALEHCRGHEVPDAAEFRLDVDRPARPIDVVQAIEGASTYKKSGGQLLSTLADFAYVPTVQQLSTSVGNKRGTVSTTLNLIGQSMKLQGVLRPEEEAGIGRLWLWARARRPLLKERYP